MPQQLEHLGALKSFLEKPGKCVVFFEDPGNIASKAVAAALDRLESKKDGPSFGRINLAQYPAVQQRIGIHELPTVWFVNEDCTKTAIVSGSQGGAYASAYKSFLSPAGTDKVEEEFECLDLVTRCCHLEDYQMGKLIEENLAILVIPPGTKEPAEEVLKKVQEESGSAAEWLVLKLAENIEAWSSLARNAKFIESKTPIVIVNGNSYPVGNVPKITPEEVEAYNSRNLAALDDKIKKLQNLTEFMLFMKGTKAEPYCKFSKAMVATLNAAGINFGYFNIFEDSAVRERTKVLSNWPTYPQLYVKGELVGGLDVVKAEVEAAGGVDKLKEHLLNP